MKFNFAHISYTDVKGYSLLNKPSEGTSKTDPENRAEKLVDTLLTEPKKGLPKLDHISDFYSAIKGGDKGLFQYAHTKRISNLVSSSLQRTNLAINKNTADRHGRT